MFSTSSSAQGDHMPIPKRNGGVETVPCCKVCHELKDNFKLGTWDVGLVSEVLKEMATAGRFTKIFMAKWLASYSDLCSVSDTKKATAMKTQGKSE
jgi:hypothetical protein